MTKAYYCWCCYDSKGNRAVGFRLTQAGRVFVKIPSGTSGFWESEYG